MQYDPALYLEESFFLIEFDIDGTVSVFEEWIHILEEARSGALQTDLAGTQGDVDVLMGQAMALGLNFKLTKPFTQDSASILVPSAFYWPGLNERIRRTHFAREPWEEAEHELFIDWLRGELWRLYGSLT